MELKTQACLIGLAVRWTQYKDEQGTSLVFTHLPIFLMPQKSATGAKKKSAMKGLALKEAAVREAAVKSLKTASGKHATRGKENHPPIAAASSSGSMSVPVSARHMYTDAQSTVPALNQGVSPCYHCLSLTPLSGDTVPMPAITESHQDLRPVAIDTVQQSPKGAQADLIIARGEYFTFFSAHTPLIIFF